MSTDLTFDLQSFGTAKQIEALKKASFPTLDMNNFMVAMKIAKQYGLDPFAKEIWGWEQPGKGGREQSGKTMIVVSNAGYMRIARSQPGFISITAQAVFPGDEFSIDFLKNEVCHKIDISKRKKGENPIGAYAVLEYLSNGKERKNIKFVQWEEYARSDIWNVNKSAMITKVATTVVCREVYGLSGLYTDDEMPLPPPQKDAPKTIVPPDLSQITLPQETGTIEEVPEDENQKILELENELREEQEDVTTH